MRIVSLIVASALVCITATAVSAAADAPQERLVKSVPLQAFFHTQRPWELQIYQPVLGDVPVVEEPAVRVCFTGPHVNDPRPHTDCTSLYAPVYARSVTYPCQIFDNAELEMLPGPGGKASRPSLVVRANYSSGTAGALHGVFVWTWENWSHSTPKKPGDWFFRSFESVTSERGQQKFVKTGPLAGLFVSVDQIPQYGDTFESPMHFEMNVYVPAAMGYMKVLSLLSEKRYPSNHTDKGTPDPIAVLIPEITRALKAVYPDGAQSVLGH